jgi:anti-sigma B factor antagonist
MPGGRHALDLVLRDRDEGTWKVLQVRGELDLHTATALRDRLANLIEGGNERVAVDMTGVPFMDSSSLGILVVYLKRLREKGGDLALVGVAGSPGKVLAITGMDRVFPMFGSSADLPRS